MACLGSRGGSERKHRSYLLLTAIFLIWNAGAAGLTGTGAEAPSPLRVGSQPDRGTSPPEAVRGRTAPVLAQKGPPSLRQRYLLDKRIDINAAPASEIAELPGISPAVAAAVVAERKRAGGFRAPEDLLQVKGIKAKRLKKILPFLATMENN